ncbi:hypothetical protein Tco_1140285, partial [Tanacetum coccineum]
MEVRPNQNILNTDVDSNENTKKIEILDRVKRRGNKFNNFQGEKKKMGNSKRAPDAMVDYAKLTDPEKEAYTGDKEVGQKKPFSDYHVISDVKSFVKFIKKIPDDNKAKLAESPFTHFLNLENEKLQLDY